MSRRRWRTPFGSWVKRYGAARLGQELGLSGPVPVYQWIGGARIPRPEHALRIVALAQGRVRLEHIFAQRAAVQDAPPA
jgi:hypothetical protein